MTEYYVATNGSDRWSGMRPQGSAGNTDGPFKTIIAARNAIRRQKSKMNGLMEPVTVHVRDGLHFIQDTLEFTPQDSGTRNCPITYKAFGSEKPRVSGGMRITGWERQPDGLWTVHLPRVEDGHFYFQQLFADGCRVTRARLPHDGWHKMDGYTCIGEDRCYRFKEGDFRSFRNLEDVQVAFLRSWDDGKLRVAALDEGNSCVLFESFNMPEPTVGDPYDEMPRARYFVDNVFEGMDSAGRWYLDRKTGMLYFRPEGQNDPNDMEIIASVQDCLLRCTGTRSRHLEHIHFEGLSFEHADWSLADGGWQPQQSDLVDPSAVEFIDASDCAFVGNTVSHVGGYALSLSGGCRRIQITGNEICDAGSGGIKIGEWVSSQTARGIARLPVIPRVAETKRNQEHTISYNHIHDCGKLFFGCVGIWIGHSSDNIVSHNRIHDLPYTGISVGYTWSTAETRCKRNMIERNEVYRVMQLMSDGAGIYCLGRSAGTVIQHNVVYGCRPAFTTHARGIYLDESATGIVVRNNVVYDTGDGAMLLHVCWDNLIENNIFLEGCTSQMYFCFERDDAGQRNIIRRNIMAYTGENVPLYQSYVWPRTGQYFTDQNLICSRKQPAMVKINMDEDIKWYEAPVMKMPDEVGLDPNSVFADPGFIDLEAGDLRLKEDSPAFDIGFVPFDIDLSGLQAYIALRSSQQTRKPEESP